MKMYVEVDNRVIKENNDNTKDKKSDKKNNEESKKLLESYGLSKNAQILTE